VAQGGDRQGRRGDRRSGRTAGEVAAGHADVSAILPAGGAAVLGREAGTLALERRTANRTVAAARQNWPPPGIADGRNGTDPDPRRLACGGWARAPPVTTGLRRRP